MQGVEVSAAFDGTVPEGFEITDLAPCAMLVFQGPAFEALWDVMSDYDPAIIGYAWAPDDSPRFQLAPMGYRGYIEGKPVRHKIKKNRFPPNGFSYHRPFTEQTRALQMCRSLQLMECVWNR
ncbi:MAG: hypothetical protein JXR76_14250 [Deltaproteobacteria bacterium]|nr:hypothetical protein [Deltaproteobacteria bacterium]